MNPILLSFSWPHSAVSAVCFGPSCYPSGFLASFNQQKLIRGQTRNSGKALQGPLLQWRGARGTRTNRSPRGASLFLTQDEGRGVTRGQAGGGMAQVVCPPLNQWCFVQGNALQQAAFAPGSFKCGDWVFGSLCILCPEFTLIVHAHSYFQSHIVSLYFVAGGEVCHVRALQHRVPGPRSVSILVHL